MTAFLGRLLVGLFLNYVAMLLTPPPEKPKAAKNIEGVPKAEEGDEPLWFGGTVWIADPHAVWHGHKKTKEIKASGGKK